MAQKKTLVGSVLLEYCKQFREELEGVEKGIYAHLDWIQAGKTHTAQDIIDMIEHPREKENVANPQNMIAVFLLALLPPLFFVDHAAELFIGEAVFIGAWYYLMNLAYEKEDDEKKSKYIRLRSDSRIVAIIGDMVGCISPLVSKESNPREVKVLEEIDKVLAMLNELGGVLNFYTVKKLKYFVMQIEGYAAFLLQTGITIDELVIRESETES